MAMLPIAPAVPAFPVLQTFAEKFAFTSTTPLVATSVVPGVVHKAGFGAGSTPFVAVPWYGCPHCLYMAMLSDGLVLQESEPGFFEEMISPWLSWPVTLAELVTESGLLTFALVAMNWTQ